ncbi:MAG: hypothetical protein GTO13_04755 [Proteobacteria bacterium]|nr:hypothetical protein [Pseudomonadota bacterium]
MGSKLLQEDDRLAERVSFIVKTQRVKAKDIRKALEEAGIEVRSVIEVFREEGPEEEEVVLNRS